MPDLLSFLEFLVTPLLSSPNQLKITTTGNQITIALASQDAGRVIGKHGSTIQAIRSLVRSFCTQHKLIFPNITLKTDQLS